MPVIPAAVATEAATVAARRGDEEHVHAFRRVLRQRAAHSQRFIVGMGEHGQQPPSRTHRALLLI
jgi:hypothetical protein